MYSSSVYFARLIQAAIDDARLLHGTRVFESEMSDVLRDLAAQGLGVAWLAESSVDQASGLCRWPAATGMSKWPCWPTSRRPARGRP